MEGRKVALITGIKGKHCSYVSEFLLDKGYLVIVIARSSRRPHYSSRLEHLLKKYQFSHDDACPLVVKYGDLSDASSLRTVLEEVKPDEVYNLGAQSHVGISFNNPLSTIDINTLGTLRLLDAIRDMKLPCKFYQASSSEMFGASPPPQNEWTPFKPQSPYGVSKVAAFHLVRLYREAYGVFASNGILFNHESPRRGINFVTRKITREIARIILGEVDKIHLGNLDAKRDWGFSGEYVQAMWRILQHDRPDDFVIATQETHTVREFLQEAFGLLGLNYENFVIIEDRFKRPAEVPALLGDSSKAKHVLGWEPKIKFKELVVMMLDHDLKEALEGAGVIPIENEVQREQGYYIQKAKEIAAQRKK